MAVKVGDYVQALLVTHVPLAEVDIDWTREGLVVEMRDGDSQLILQTWQGNEFTCFTEGAVVMDVSTLDTAIQKFVFFEKLRLNLRPK